MAPRAPRPKIADGVILFGTVCLMGAPTVFPHLVDWVGRLLFYGGLAGMLGYIAFRWGAWILGLFHPETHAGAGVNNAGGIFVGGNNTGAQTVVHGDVNIHHAPPSPEEAGRTYLPVGFTVERIMSFYEGNTNLQAKRLIKPLIGKWLRYTGIVGGVSELGGGNAAVWFQEKYGPFDTRVMCRFEPKHVDALHILKRGDRITVIGELDDADYLALNFKNCEVVGE